MPAMPDKPRLQMPRRGPLRRRSVEEVLSEGVRWSPASGVRQSLTSMVPEGRGRASMDALTGGSLGVGLLDFLPVTGEALAAEDFRMARDAGDGLGMTLAAVGAIPLVPSLAGVRAAAKAGEAAADVTKAGAPRIRTWHGSPVRNIDKFSRDAAGTGTGGDLYGDGVYLTEDNPLATQYRNRSRERNLGRFDLDSAIYELGLDGFLGPVDRAVIEPMVWERLRHGQQRAGVDELVEEFLSGRAKQRRDLGLPDGLEGLDEGLIYELLSRQEDALRGAVYELDLRAGPDELLDLGMPIGAQPRAVREALVRAALEAEPDGRWDISHYQGGPAYRSLREAIDQLGQGDLGSPDLWPDTYTGEDFYDALAGFKSSLWNRDLAKANPPDGGVYWTGRSANRWASDALRDKGLVGARYQDSVGRTAPVPFNNYVVYDPDRIDILRQYGFLPPAMVATEAARGASRERSSERTRNGAPRKPARQVSGERR